MRKTELLIEPITGEFAWKESVPEGFVPREEFINRTGIFVTPSQFEFIYDVDFKDSNMTIDEFISKFEENFSGEVMEVPLEGTFKYIFNMLITSGFIIPLIFHFLYMTIKKDFFSLFIAQKA